MATSQKTNDAARFVFITAFTFLSSLTLQKVFNTLWDKLTEKLPNKFYAVVLSQIFLFLVVFSVALLSAIYWVNYGEEVI